jgi:hypothetical protein
MKPLRLLAAAVLLATHAFGGAAVPAEAISFTTERITTTENSGLTRLTVVRAGGTGAALNANVALTAPDATVTNFPANFASGASSVFVDVPLGNDAVFSGPLIFTATLTTAAAGVTVSPLNSILITRLDDENFTPAAASFEGFIDSPKSIAEFRGPITVTATATGAYTAKFRLGLKKFTAKGFFDPTGAATVIFARKDASPLRLVLQRYETTTLPEILGDLIIDGFDLFATLRRTLGKTELAQLPADRTFVGALTHTESGVVLASPTHASLSAKGAWLFTGRTFDDRPVIAKAKALTRGFVCFANLPFGTTPGSRLGFLSYDAPNHQLTGIVSSNKTIGGSPPFSFGYFKNEAGPLAAYIAPVAGEYPGPFAGGDGASDLTLTDLSNDQISQSFTWTLAGKVTQAATPNLPISFKFSPKTGFATGKLILPGASQPTAFTLALISAANLPPQGGLLGTIPDGDEARRMVVDPD